MRPPTASSRWPPRPRPPRRRRVRGDHRRGRDRLPGHLHRHQPDGRAASAPASTSPTSATRSPAGPWAGPSPPGRPSPSCGTAPSPRRGKVTVTDAGYNAAIATGATASFGFNGSWTGSNPAPAAFALNGVTLHTATTPTSATLAPRRIGQPAGVSPSTSPPAHAAAPPAGPGGRLERLDRGLISVRSGTGNLVSWRWLATDPANVGVQRLPGGHQGQRDADHRLHELLRRRRAGRRGLHGAGRGRRRRAGRVGAGPAVRQRLPGRADPDPDRLGYSANDASVGDLDGDGQLRDRPQVGSRRTRRTTRSPAAPATSTSTRTSWTAPGCGGSTWAATSAPARTTRSSWCTTTTATARPRWP